MKTVLITGTSRGIGLSTAEKFLDEGWFVIGTSTSGKSPIKNQNFKSYLLDLNNPESIKDFINLIKKENFKIDTLINNAGVYLDPFDSTINIKILRKTLEINLIGLITLTESLVPLINSGGSIISVSSQAGSITGHVGQNVPTYKISKVGVNMYTKILSDRLKTQSITVSAIDPGWTKTDMGGPGGIRDPKDPANEIYKLAISDVETGNFWFQGQKRSW